MSPIKIKQHDITDCGAACLASIASHWHFHIPIARIRQYAGTDKKGTNVLGLRAISKKMLPCQLLAGNEYIFEKQMSKKVQVWTVKIMYNLNLTYHEKCVFRKLWSFRIGNA